LESQGKGRERNPDYWKQYRANNPAAVEKNRQQQKQRDQKRRLCRLANNNLALPQVLVFEAIAHHWAPATQSCQQQPSGETAGSAS
jgi:hypothetical protein